MLPPLPQLCAQLHAVLRDKEQQGHAVHGLAPKLDALPPSYDALWEFAHQISNLPLRDDWVYVEPNELADIWAECDPSRAQGALGTLDLEDLSRRIEAAFQGSVCGCVLGKPVEVNPTLEGLRGALEATGDWPLNDYFSETTLTHLPKRHGSWRNTVRENIQSVEPDDDLNYSILGMMVLERHGIGFTQQQLRGMWLQHVPLAMTWGPERTTLAKAAVGHVYNEWREPVDEWPRVLNPGDELCGAQIRADAYGYGAAGRPALAAELAWRDASFTHRRTGVYAAMWTAAVIAAAPVARTPLEVFEIALGFVPRRSRFYQIVADSLEEVSRSSDWMDGYHRLHGKYQQYAHCRVYQESGTLINTLRWAESVGGGICLQVMQGNDTDSYGATAGSILGAHFGPGHLEERWLAPFQDNIHTALASFFEHSLGALTRRMGQLPHKIAAGLEAAPASP